MTNKNYKLKKNYNKKKLHVIIKKCKLKKPQ